MKCNFGKEINIKDNSEIKGVVDVHDKYSNAYTIIFIIV